MKPKFNKLRNKKIRQIIRANITYTQVGFSWFVGYKSVKFLVQFFVESSV